MTESQALMLETAEEVLRQRAESLARETSTEEIGELISILAFRLGEEWYGVSISDVREIFQEYSITPMPCVPEHVLGVVNVRGEILSVTDPARLMMLGSVPVVSGALPPAVVVSDGSVSTALVVDAIGDILEVAPEDFEAPVSAIDRTYGEFVAASISVGDRMLSLINTARILEPVVSAPRP
jgi:purine-binding chemotaxis protein CheW